MRARFHIPLHACLSAFFAFSVLLSACKPQIIVDGYKFDDEAALAASGAAGSLHVISGVVQLGTVVGAQVYSYNLKADGTPEDNYISSALTDENGNYVLDQIPENVPILLVALGGTYTDETTHSPTANTKVTALIMLTRETGSLTASITPITTLAAAQALARMKGVSEEPSQAISKTNTELGGVLGFSKDAQIVEIVPANPEVTLAAQGISPNDDSARMAVVIAGVSAAADAKHVDQATYIENLATAYAAKGIIEKDDIDTISSGMTQFVGQSAKGFDNTSIASVDSDAFNPLLDKCLDIYDTWLTKTTGTVPTSCKTQIKNLSDDCSKKTAFEVANDKSCAKYLKIQSDHAGSSSSAGNSSSASPSPSPSSSGSPYITLTKYSGQGTDYSFSVMSTGSYYLFNLEIGSVAWILADSSVTVTLGNCMVPASPSVQLGSYMGPNTFSVTALALGNCGVNITDSNGRTAFISATTAAVGSTSASPSPSPSASASSYLIQNMPIQTANFGVPCPTIGVVYTRAEMASEPYYGYSGDGAAMSLDMQCQSRFGAGFYTASVKTLSCAPDARGAGFGPNAVLDLTCSNSSSSSSNSSSSVASSIASSASSSVAPSPSPSVTFSPTASVNTIAQGQYHTCVIQADHTVKCWGWNVFSEMGNGTSTGSQLTAATVPGLANVTQLAAGGLHTCALLSDKTVKCWGNNGSGQLGISPQTIYSSETPVAVPGLTGVAHISAGGGNTCAILGTGEFYCWGDNSYGEIGLGNHTTTSYSTPTAVPGFSNTLQVSVGGSHVCAIDSNGALKCWGWNQAREVDGTSTSIKDSPTAVVGLSGNVKEVYAGTTATCAIMTDKTVNCWGTWHPSGVTAVSGWTNVEQISMGINAFHAIHSDGSLSAWGWNYFGEIGDGTASNSTSYTATVNGAMTNVDQLPRYSQHTYSCALFKDSSVKCWGGQADHGELGYGGVATSYFPIAVQGL